MASPQVRDRRTTQWSGFRVVVVDVETTGLTPKDRVISIALCEIVEGRVQNAIASFIDPDLPFLGAYDIHGITVETLKAGGAVPFDDFRETLRTWLTPRGDEVVALSGHNVIFDALMLNYEMERLDDELPPLRLMNTQSLAQSLGLRGSSLGELLDSVELRPPDTHTAISDAMMAAEALLLLGDKHAETDPDTPVTARLEEFDRTLQLTRTGKVARTRAPQRLTPEHELSHHTDLTVKENRETALAVCVAHGCTELVGRCYDSIQTKASARQVARWVRTELDRDDLTRATRGRLLAGLGVAVGQTGDGKLIRATFDTLTEPLAAWGPCASGDECDRCADAKSKRTCRFQSIRYALVRTFLGHDAAPDEDPEDEDRDKVQTLLTGRADAFLPYDPLKKRGPGGPREGWFHKLMRAGDKDTAGYGAAVAARTGARSRTAGWERGILSYSWDKGARNARLADYYSRILLVDGSDDPARPHLQQAHDICVEALADQGAAHTYVYEVLDARKQQIEGRWAAIKDAEAKAAAKAERAKAWAEKHPDRARTDTANRRPPRPSVFRLD